MNTLLPEIAAVRYASSVQYIAARLRVPRHALSCSVIIPCHNEEDNIAECVRRVPLLGSATEIVVVDDGSTDETRRRVEELMRIDSRVRLIAYDKNHGKANAVA
jgi:cellulose synthase/poly-beta-1,6-N-acetylglucosamine synthase-like glycosyltransferase